MTNPTENESAHDLPDGVTAQTVAAKELVEFRADKGTPESYLNDLANLVDTLRQGAGLDKREAQVFALDEFDVHGAENTDANDWFQTIGKSSDDLMSIRASLSDRLSTSTIFHYLTNEPRPKILLGKGSFSVDDLGDGDGQSGDVVVSLFKYVTRTASEDNLPRFGALVERYEASGNTEPAFRDSFMLRAEDEDDLIKTLSEHVSTYETSFDMSKFVGEAESIVGLENQEGRHTLWSVTPMAE